MTGEELRQRRLALNMTQAELGRRLGVSGQAVYKWETGRVKIERSEMIHLAMRYLEIETASRLLGVEPKELLRDED